MSPPLVQLSAKISAAAGRASKPVLSRLIAKTTETLLPAEIVGRIRTAREWKHWIDSLTPELLDDLTHAPVEVRRALFKANVRLVEIEVHARCNRVCGFCPNSIIDRRLNQTVTDPRMLERVFRQLGSIDYAGQIKVARYSEPLANREYLYQQIAAARVLAPRAQLAIVTNTDYLTPQVLEQLRTAGLDVVYMSLYLKDREQWSAALARQYSERLARKIGARLRTITETRDSVRCTYEWNGLDMRSACNNFDSYGADRGAVMQQYMVQMRLGPCREPFETFVIDYTGAVMPCCNLRSDLPQHRGYVACDLSRPDSSIFDAYAGALAAWRASMLGLGPKGQPCTTCRHRDIPAEFLADVGVRLKRRLAEIGKSQFYVPPVHRPELPAPARERGA